MEPFTDLYALLNTTPTATTSDLRTAYRRTALTTHPDKFHTQGPHALRTADTRFKALKSAFDTLSDPIKRGKYDILYKRFENDKRRRETEMESEKLVRQAVGIRRRRREEEERERDRIEREEEEAWGEEMRRAREAAEERERVERGVVVKVMVEEGE